MRVPTDDKAGTWAQELVEECYSSHETRCEQIAHWKSYYFTGKKDGSPAVYNRCFPHVDRLASMLFSPVDARFDIEFDATEKSNVHAMGRASARFLNREFHRCGIDLNFAEAVNWALVKGATIVKTIPHMKPDPKATKETPERMRWMYDGLQSWLIQPELFGVLREDIAELDYQDAFVCSQYLTPNAFRRAITGNPREKELYDQVLARQKKPEETRMDEDFFHQIIIGGVTPVNTKGTTSTGTGKVNIFGVPQPFLDPKVQRTLIRVDELWVKDDARQDYTTLRLVGDIMVNGRDIHENLHGVVGQHGFTKICPNETAGYFWGMSEIAQIYRLQDMLNSQIDTIRQLARLKSDPPRAFIGFAGMNQQKYKVLKRAGGMIAEDSPAAKIETLAPEIPKELFDLLEKTLQMFDDVAGFTPIISGEGEQGVRSGVHANTLHRNSSPRMRDRALLVERQLIEVGDDAMSLMQAKKARVFAADDGGQFLLDQLPDDARVTVDSHTASPAFAEDAQVKADKLIRVGAITPEDYIMLTHPPHEDRLAAQAKQRADQQAQLMAELAKTHPELLAKSLGGGKRR